ncbi:MAG: DNA repair protein RadC [Candidatus Micrarchaeia archaeon]|jgi:DNA repair protein RadC
MPNTPIREWVEEERPRELLVKNGPEHLNSAKLLAILLRTGGKGYNAEDLARRLLNHFGSLRALDVASVSELQSIGGIGLAKAAQVKAALEVGKRLLREEAGDFKRIKTAKDIIQYVTKFHTPYLQNAKKEYFNVVLVDIKNRPISNIELYKGNSARIIIKTSEVIREAIQRSACGLILVHNHPSGDPTPSEDDISITTEILNACNLVGLRLLDHIIIGKNTENYASLAEMGVLMS